MLQNFFFYPFLRSRKNLLQKHIILALCISGWSPPALRPELNLGKCIQGQLSAPRLPVPLVPLRTVATELPVPSVPNRGRPFSRTALSAASPSWPPTPHHHHHRSPSPICLSALRTLSSGCALHLPPLPPSLPALLSPSLPASFSLMRRDRYGRGGRGGTCLSKPAEENEGSDEGGMLCILNGQTPVRGRRGRLGLGIYQ